MLIQEDLSEIITKIQNISPEASVNNAKESFGLHKDDSLDNIDNETLLDFNIECLCKDLCDIGIYVSSDTTDFFSNLYDIKMSLYIIEYLVPTTLLVKLQQDKNLYNLLHDLLYSPVSDDQFVTEYMCVLGGYNNQAYDPECSVGCTYLIDKLNSDDVYVSILKKLLDLVSNNNTPLELTHKELLTYNNYVVDLDKKMFIFCEKLKTDLKDKTVDETLLNKLDRRLVITKQQFTNPDNTALYNFIFCKRDKTEEESLVYKRKRKQVFCSLKISPMYNSVRDIETTLLDILGYCCFMYARYNENNKDQLLIQLSKLEKLYSKYSQTINKISKLI